MAVLSRITCKGCGTTTEVNHSPAEAPPEICGVCQHAEAASKREQHFAELDALQIEERLRRIEAWIYDYRPQWVPPPRF
jgi:DNA replicative helicase MCM subunit Mcm2 (Cdc46/Mcm family)